MPLALEDLTGKIIGPAIDVHRELGPGFVEAVYENALVLELRACHIPFQRQLAVPILYRGVEVGLHRLDLLAFDPIVVELKAVSRLEDAHFVVLRSYLRAVGRDHGLLLNFARPTLEIRRVTTRRDPPAPVDAQRIGSWPTPSPASPDSS